MNKSRNTLPDVRSLGLEPLSARSIILSVLLGSHPPDLAGRQLTALAELFGIRPGTLRTAFSRMTASGELVAAAGRYSLGPRMLQRQRQQDQGRSTPSTAWDGRWFTAIVSADRRSVAERRAFRSAMVGARLAELRPDIWMRPANVEKPERPEEVLLLHGDLTADDPHDLVDQLWPLAEIDERSNRLRTAVDDHRRSLDNEDPSVLPATFVLSAAVVHFLRTEPQLPAELTPSVWSPPKLRPLYDDFEAAFQRLLRLFLRSVDANSDT